MARKHPGFEDVRLMERLNLSDRRRPTYACHNMFDSVSSAELRELRLATSSRIELSSTIRQDLLGLSVQSHGFFQKPDRMFRRRIVMDP